FNRQGHRENRQSSQRNSLACGGGVGLLQQAPRLRDQVCNFKWFYQMRQVVLSEEVAHFGFRVTGEGKQETFFKTGALLGNPATNLGSAPSAGEFSIDNHSVKRFRQQARADVFSIH